jgi:class III poly(R)-hydroxyalkanoic acid synthase PhaE subunit
MAPWLKAWQVAPSHMGVAMAGEGPSEMIELANLYWQAYDQTFGMMVNTPGVGLTRELTNKISQGFESWKTLTQAMDDYQYLILDAWSGVMEQVLRDMMKRAEQGQPVESIRDLVKMWTGAADKSFAQVATSEKYAEVQGRFLSSYMDYRIKEQQIVEEFLRYSYVPTRSEMDEAHRNVYELRKEVKALKKALKADGKSVPTRATAGSEA